TTNTGISFIAVASPPGESNTTLLRSVSSSSTASIAEVPPALAPRIATSSMSCSSSNHSAAAINSSLSVSSTANAVISFSASCFPCSSQLSASYAAPWDKTTPSSPSASHKVPSTSSFSFSSCSSCCSVLSVFSYYLVVHFRNQCCHYKLIRLCQIIKKSKISSYTYLLSPFPDIIAYVLLYGT